MSDAEPQTLLTRIGSILTSRARRRVEHGVRGAIAELVAEAAGTVETPGTVPELDRQERALIANVLRLRGTTADDVMVPRADIVAMPVDFSFQQALELIRREGHSRMPVYRDQLDDIAGMVHIKDLFAHLGQPDEFRMEAILRRPLLVAPQMPVLDLLLQMRMNRMHLSLVVDEYGGIDGLVTIEDLVETITGDISDEHDEPDLPMVMERPDGTLDLDARMPLEAFVTRFALPLTEEEREADIDTIGGLVFRIAGRVPARGEVIGHASGIEFRVLEADARRIRRVRARLPQPAPAVTG